MWAEMKFPKLPDISRAGQVPRGQSRGLIGRGVRTGGKIHHCEGRKAEKVEAL